MSKVLVIGDSCKDIFIYGDIERISPEAPVPVFKPMNSTENGGMAKNVEANLKVMGCNVDLITNSNNIIKKRYVDDKSNQMVLRVDENDSCKRIDKQKLVKLYGYDAIIISDYCKGFLMEDDIEYICNNYENVFIDTKKMLGGWIKNASFIKINHMEHQKNFERIPNYPELEDKIIVTRGKDGCIFRNEIFPVKEVPVKDVSGAGDTFLAGIVSEYIKSGNIKKSIKFAQDCTTKVVQKHGVATV